MNEIVINSTKLPIREYKGNRVVTFKDIDEVHGRKEGTAKRNFYTNRERFIEGVDYFKIQQYEIRTVGIESPNGGIVLTESGYLMLAKSFTDDLAWKVQRELVNNYFRVKTPAPEQPAVETSEYCYFPKTFKGEPVITIADFEYFTGISHHNIYKPLKRQCKLGEEYFSLSNAGIAQYKRENPGVSRLQSVALVLKESAVRKLLSYFKLSVKIPMIEEKKEKPVIKPATANVDECIITLGVLGVVRDNLKKAENREAEEAVNVAIKYTSWELSKRIISQ